MFLSRRSMLKSSSVGFGYLAFASLSTWADQEKKDNPLAPKAPHFAAKAKRVIFLCMEGAPSHVDTFDYKPKLTADNGKAYSRGGRGGGGFGGGTLLGSPWKFNQSGEGGLWISELFPELAKHADEMCLLRSMYTDVPAHPQAFTMMHTGSSQFKRPSMGAWALYGLGSENENLPGFVTINPAGGNGGPANYASSFLPAIYQGTPIRSGGGFGFGGGGGGARGGAEPTIPNIKNPGQTKDAQRLQLDFVQSLNKEALERDEVNPGIEGVIESYELAFKMQGEVPKVLSLASETDATKKLYGIGEQTTENFGRQCLMARRLLEAGVRFVEVTMGGWDHHQNLKTALAGRCQATDKPIAGLLADLKARGMLKDTLILWGGEFGRTPYAQGTDGRDHNARGFVTWMAGGGVKGGLSYGSTDDYGAEAVENKMHIHDWHATILHLLGLDHNKLTFNYAGRSMRLTDLKGNVHKDVVS
jgi:hypothetical protein